VKFCFWFLFVLDFVVAGRRFACFVLVLDFVVAGLQTGAVAKSVAVKS